MKKSLHIWKKFFTFAVLNYNNKVLSLTINFFDYEKRGFIQQRAF